jgi:hypothetical protein
MPAGEALDGIRNRPVQLFHHHWWTFPAEVTVQEVRQWLSSFTSRATHFTIGNQEDQYIQPIRHKEKVKLDSDWPKCFGKQQ